MYQVSIKQQRAVSPNPAKNCEYITKAAYIYQTHAMKKNNDTEIHYRTFHLMQNKNTDCLSIKSQHCLLSISAQDAFLL